MVRSIHEHSPASGVLRVLLGTAHGRVAHCAQFNLPPNGSSAHTTPQVSYYKSAQCRAQCRAQSRERRLQAPHHEQGEECAELSEGALCSGQWHRCQPLQAGTSEAWCRFHAKAPLQPLMQSLSGHSCASKTSCMNATPTPHAEYKQVTIIVHPREHSTLHNQACRIECVQSG